MAEHHPWVIDMLFARYGIRDRWTPLPATGVANTIYATRDVVLRVATDHPEAITDARTESVAAPVAHAAGIRTPRLIAFDDSRVLVDRPFSLWERIHGDALGTLELDPKRLTRAWRDVGRELARLHDRVTACPDPHGYLDTPGRALDLAEQLDRMRAAELINPASADRIAALIEQLAPHVAIPASARFLHDDVHAWNIMCTAEGMLLALIDWGDAGWGDPTLDFAYAPLEVIPDALEGYESERAGGLGDFPAARIVWDKLHGAMQRRAGQPGCALEVDELQRFLDARS